MANLAYKLENSKGFGEKVHHDFRYGLYDGRLVLTTAQWQAAGLTEAQFKQDSAAGLLRIARRGIHGNTLIYAESVVRPERKAAIEQAMGAATLANSTAYELRVDATAQAYYANYMSGGGIRLCATSVRKYTARASLFEAMRRGWDAELQWMAAQGRRLGKYEWLQSMLAWQQAESTRPESLLFGVKPYLNVRGLEAAYSAYLKSGYASLIHAGAGNDNARKVDDRTRGLLLALHRTKDKPFVGTVHERFNRFVNGQHQLCDKQTGEVFAPSEFVRHGKPLKLSYSTVWNYLKQAMGYTSIYRERNGQFDYQNALRPKHHRKAGEFSLSKISMDDVALSRKATIGGKEVWVYKYIAVDVVSGYYFRPAYVIGKPSERTVYEAFRNMFCELNEMGLPMPAELEVEHHLMSQIPWLDEAFRFVRFCQSPTEKRAEHAIRALKWGTAHEMGHTRGRWYAKHEAYRAVRTKVNGDYVEPTSTVEAIIADDLADIAAHNAALHPKQNTFKGMSREQVLRKRYNPELKTIDLGYLLQYIGNRTETSLRNNDYCAVANQEFEIADFGMLKRLKPNDMSLTAYWLPENDGRVDRVYLYQGETYIGEANNRAQWAYNECAVERTEADEAAMLHQHKRLAKFDAAVAEYRRGIPELATPVNAEVLETPVELVLEQNEQPKNYEDTDTTDYAALAIDNL